MKILYLHQYFTTPEYAGGTRSYELARRLVAAGHEVRLITSASELGDWSSDHPGLVTHSEIEGIKLTVLNVPYSNKMGNVRRIWAFLQFAALTCVEVLRQPADIVFATSTPLTIAIPGMLGKLWHRAPFVFEVRDLWPELPIADGALKNPVAKVLAYALARITYKAANKIIALSPGIEQRIVDLGVDQAKITVVPNACDTELFSAQPVTMNTAPLILYAGSFGRINNLCYLVDIAAELKSIAPDIRVLLVGKGAEEDKIREYAAKRGTLDVNLQILPVRSKKEMPAVIGGATVALSLFAPLPFMETNSANKFFDALAAGRPVAINYGGWQADLLAQTGAGLLLPTADAPAAARILAQFVGDEQKLAQASVAARSLAQQFDRDKMAGLFESVLNEAVEEKTRPKESLTALNRNRTRYKALFRVATFVARIFE